MSVMCVDFRFVLLLIVVGTSLTSPAQPGTSQKYKPDIKRQLFHDYVDKEQKNALKLDGKADDVFKISNDEDISYFITQSLTKKVDQLQVAIETDTASDHSRKVNYLRGIEYMLKNFVSRVKARRFNPSNWPSIMDLYETAMRKDMKGESLETLIQKNSYDVGNMIMASGAFDKNVAKQATRFILVRKYLSLHPDQTFVMMKDNFDVPFRDSLIIVAAHKYPGKLYDFAAANNKLGFAIRKIDDPLVKTVSKMATSGGSGQAFFPFLDNLVKGRLTFEEVDAVKNDEV
ncbi:MAG TPA: hypothetical protein VM935_13735, partial [Chitinophagaceae bacterium]|nr:hypothetical protein [Chitinophagaceae bacterium]